MNIRLMDLIRRSGAGSPVERRPRASAQATVEFALVSIPLFLVVFGIVDFGILFETRLSLDSGTRAAARFGAVQSGALSNAASAPSNTIQGRLQATAGTSAIPNDDAHIVITYFVTGSGSPTQCGKYVASTNSITYGGGYNRANCLAVDNMIQVQVTHAYKFNTPIISQAFSAGVPITSTATALIEQPG
jgi:Flp pilus assembly protein TadG